MTSWKGWETSQTGFFFLSWLCSFLIGCEVLKTSKNNAKQSHLRIWRTDVNERRVIKCCISQVIEYALSEFSFLFLSIRAAVCVILYHFALVASTLRQRNLSFKRSFISTVGLPSTLILMLYKPEEFEKRTFRFRVEAEKHFEYRAVWKRWRHNMWFSSLRFPQTQIQNEWPVFVAGVLKSSGVVWTENIRCIFRAKSPFSNSSCIMYTLAGQVC